MLGPLGARPVRCSALSNHVPVPSPEDVRAPGPERNGRPAAEAIEEGVLSNLPRTRPQRTTERRIASREGKRPPGRARRAPAAEEAPRAASNGAANGAAAAGADARSGTRRGATKSEPQGSSSRAAPKRSAPREGAAKKPRRTAKPRAQAASKRPRPEPVETAPPQGFESESSRTTGSVQPPGGGELLASAVEIAGEVAKAGVSAGERVLKDLFSRLPH